MAPVIPHAAEVGALLRPGESAIFVTVRAPRPTFTGGTSGGETG